MKMLERNIGAAKTALLIHPMLSSGEGIEQCVTNFWGEDVHCFIPDLSAHGGAFKETYHSAKEEAKMIHRLPGGERLHPFTVGVWRFPWRCGAV